MSNRMIAYVCLARPLPFRAGDHRVVALVLALAVLIAAGWLVAIEDLTCVWARARSISSYMLALVRPGRRARALATARRCLADPGAGRFRLGRRFVCLAHATLGEASLLPPAKSEPQRFHWHALLQAVPIPSLRFTSATGLAISHSSEGTRGRDPMPGELATRNVVATFGGSTTYDIRAAKATHGATGSPHALEQGDGKGRFFIVNQRGAGLTTTVEHLIQTAFYQTKFGKTPRCAIYYVGWNDLRNAHIPHLDPAYADFHLPSQVDSLKVRRVGGSLVTISPLLTLAMRFISAMLTPSPISVDPYGRDPVPVTTGARCPLRAQHSRDIGHQPPARRHHPLVGQLLNRAQLSGDDLYGWLPLVRDRDLWPMEQKLNAVLARTAKELGDIYVDVPPDSFGNADFVDNGHFSVQGARRFADDLAPVVRDACR